ncbi:probable inactive DNA (cytosine-5)-methyltransferase DRM3 [Salvia hispanica]|uniref:probable inactive DNA (cytosine-5)-methyltransferase DRM3 n=1 Tax=Salvia hispanica TaxID=49212 RepID=UPI002009787C|nr:probable inactive DNA (cytosine-5)-methyltransferase DRM3 [Salvia hispanica]
MCDVDLVDISDDEDSFLLENDAGVIPKDENLDYGLPSMPREDYVASSSGTNLRSSFIGMGFAPALVDKAIKEKGEENSELILEALFAYSALPKPKNEVFDDSFSGGQNDSLAANGHPGEDLRKLGSSDSLVRLFGEDTKENAYVGTDIPVKVEFDVGDSVIEEKTTSLLKMNFSLDEVGFAMQRLGKNAAIGKLMDFIFAARMARKYEKDTNNPIPGDEETEDCNNELLFGIMEKSLQLLEMGFTENDISEAFDRCGSEAPVTLLAESIVTGGTCPLPDKYNPSVQRSLKRKMEECDSICIKTEECSSDTASQVRTSELLEKLKGKKLKGKMPEVEIDDEPNNFKKPKEEFMEDSGSAVDRMLLEAGIGKSASVNNLAPVPPRRAGRFPSFVEDRKPPISSLNPCRSLTRVVAKPPYFLYGNVTSLSRDSWGKITQFLYSVQPEFVDSQLFSALNRKEGYVHNLPTEDRFHIMPRGPTTLAEAIPYAKKWWPSWDTRKQLSEISCESTGLPYLCEKLGRTLFDCNGPPSADLQTKILQQCQAKNLVWVGKNRLSPLEPEHLEQIMGYPQHHTRIAGYTPAERLQSLKLSFQTDTLGYHLSVLKRMCPGGVTVLSFFSGIGGAEVALHRLGIRLKGVVSVEACETKRRMVKKWWENSAQSGELIQLESIDKLSSRKFEEVMKNMKGFDLVVCQNPYSGADSDSLSGMDFSMFAEFVRILQRVRSTMDRYR